MAATMAATVIQMAKGDMERDNRQRVTVLEEANKYMAKDFAEYKEFTTKQFAILISQMSEMSKNHAQMNNTMQQFKGGYWALVKLGAFITFAVGIVATIATKWSAWIK